MISIAVINPVVARDRELEQMTIDELSNCCPPDVSIEVISLVTGPESIECWLDEAAAIPGIIERVRELDGRADAIIVNCFGDPGVLMAREATRLPVVGPAESSLCMASLLGQRIGVVTVLPSVIPIIWRNIRAAGLQDNVVTVRSIGIGVAETINREVAVVGNLVTECLVAVEEDEADVLVLGCTGMAGLSNSVRDHLLANGHDIPVISPSPAALFVAYYQARMGLKPPIPSCS